MSKPLSFWKKDQKAQLEVIMRRLKSGTKGLGYWAARDAARKLGIEVNK